MTSYYLDEIDRQIDDNYSLGLALWFTPVPYSPFLLSLPPLPSSSPLRFSPPSFLTSSSFSSSPLSSLTSFFFPSSLPFLFPSSYSLSYHSLPSFLPQSWVFFWYLATYFWTFFFAVDMYNSKHGGRWYVHGHSFASECDLIPSLFPAFMA